MNSKGGSVCYKCNQVNIFQMIFISIINFFPFSQVILLGNVQKMMVAAVVRKRFFKKITLLISILLKAVVVQDLVAVVVVDEV